MSEIKIEDGPKTTWYESLDKVNEAHRDEVKGLIETAEKRNVGIEVQP